MFKQLSIECTECKHVFPLGTELRVVKHTSLKDGAVLWFTMYDCPRCGKSYVVQLDNIESETLLRKVKRSMAQGMVYRRKNERVPEKLKDKFDKGRKQLTLMRSALVFKYNNTKFVNEETGAETVLNFTVC